MLSSHCLLNCCSRSHCFTSSIDLLLFSLYLGKEELYCDEFYCFWLQIIFEFMTVLYFPLYGSLKLTLLASSAKLGCYALLSVGFQIPNFSMIIAFLNNSPRAFRPEGFGFLSMDEFLRKEER